MPRWLGQRFLDLLVGTGFIAACVLVVYLAVQIIGFICMFPGTLVVIAAICLVCWMGHDLRK